jgi:DNA-binding beta-propeller fold protein YncE
LPALLAAGALAAQDWTPWFVKALRLPLVDDSFRQPRAVTADRSTGEIFICDTFGNRVVIFDPRGLFRHQITGGAVFRAPIDIAVDSDGYIFLLANHSSGRGILLLDFDGEFVAKVPLLDLPSGAAAPELVSIALSPDGDRLYALDAANQRLWTADRDGKVLASADLTIGLTEEEIEEQVLGHVDVYGDLVLAAIPTAGRVNLFDLDGRVQGTAGIKGTSPCQTAFPVAAAVDAAGSIVILDKQRALFSHWDPESNRCLSEHSGFGNAPGALYQPADLSIDEQGRLYISQGFEGRVQVYREPD